MYKSNKLIVVGRASPTFHDTNVKFLPSCFFETRFQLLSFIEPKFLKHFQKQAVAHQLQAASRLCGGLEIVVSGGSGAVFAFNPELENIDALIQMLSRGGVRTLFVFAGLLSYLPINGIS